MHALRFATATAMVCLIAACGGSGPTGPQAGTVSGTITASAGFAIGSATVAVTPGNGTAPASVQSTPTGTYSIANVPGGSGTIAVTTVPANCAAPSPTPYSGVNGNTVTVNIQITCEGGSTTLEVGQAALFTDSASEFSTNLTMAPNGIYIMTIVNTDSASTALEDFSLGGAFDASIAGKRFPGQLKAAMHPAPTMRSVPLRRIARARLARHISPVLKNYQRAVAGHVNKMEADERRIRGLGNPFAAHAVRPPKSFSLVSSNIGDVNAVNVPVPSCDNYTTVNARTVYSGTHVQILADTSLTNWPQQYRPDSSYYGALGLEYDTLTYAKHLLTYIGDPLQYDAQLSNVGKVTILLTPVLNTVPGQAPGTEILAFVTPCDFFPQGTGQNQIPSSNVTEMIYHLVPDANNPVAFWEREIRPTLAHESKHIVSLGYHLANANFLEQTWLEEALAQISSEIWGRNYNTATWLGDAGFGATLGCEIQGDGDPCSTPSSPLTFSNSHLAFLFDYLANLDSLGAQNPETLNGAVAGRYGAGWSLARWAIDNYAGGTTPTAEAAIVKAMITNVNQNGIANVSAITKAPAPQILTYWSLATALDTATLVDSSGFFAGIKDAKTTIPSFDFRNIYAPAPYGRGYAVVPLGLATGNFTTQAITGIPGTEQLYVIMQGPANGGTQFLQLLSGAGGQISASSGFRVGIIRVQ